MICHHTEVGEFENLSVMKGERFIQSLQKVAKEYGKVGASVYETPENEDRRIERETPARKVRRKLISYRDLDRPREEGPDLRKVT